MLRGHGLCNNNRIIFNGVTMHTATAVTTIGANGKAASLFYVPYLVMERLQVTVFFIQEAILSGLYLWKAKSYLGLYRKRKERGGTVQLRMRSMVLHLILSNVIVVVRTYSPNYSTFISWRSFPSLARVK